MKMEAKFYTCCTVKIYITMNMHVTLEETWSSFVEVGTGKAAACTGKGGGSEIGQKVLQAHV